MKSYLKMYSIIFVSESKPLKALTKAKCRYDVLKRAFLFSCLTGLRWLNIQKLQWSEVSQSDIGYRITFNQQKTKGVQYLGPSPKV